MTFRLVTLAEAKEQLSILPDDTEDDARVDRLLIRISQTVMNYVNGCPSPTMLDGWTDTSGRPLTYTNGDPQRVGAVGTLDTAGNFTLTLDTNGDPVDEGISIIPGDVQAATLVAIARADNDREGEREILNETVQALLVRYRDPVLA